MAAFTPIGVQATIKGLSGFNRGLKGMRDGITKTGEAAGGVGGKFVGMGKKIASAGAVMAKVAIAGVAALGAAVAGIGAISLRAASDFESAWTGVTKTVDGLLDDTGQLTAKGRELQQGFRDLALEIPSSTEELLKLGEIAGQLGVQDDQILQFTETVAAIGVATNLAAEDAATAFARIGNIFNIAAEDIGANTEALGNTIVALGNNFATTESEIANFALRMAGAGSVAGFTQADILAIGTAMSSVGVQAERGGTAVQKVMLKMNEAAAASGQGFVDHSEAINDNVNRLTDLNAKLVTLEAKTGITGQSLLDQQQAFIAAGGSAEDFGRQLGDTERAALFKTIRSIQELTAETDILQSQQGKPISDELLGTFARLSGRTVEQFKEDWQEDAAGVFRDFVTGLGEEGDNATNVLKELELGDQRLIGAFLSLAGAGDLLTEAMTLANDEFSDGNALSAEAQKRYQTFESQVQLLKNSLKDIAITIGQPLLSFFAEQIKRIRPLINAFGKELPSAIQGLFSMLRGEAGGAEGVDKLLRALGFSEDTRQRIIAFVQGVIEVGRQLMTFVEGLVTTLSSSGGIGEMFVIPEFILTAWEGLQTVFANFAQFWAENGPQIRAQVQEAFGALAEIGAQLAAEIIPFLIEQFQKISTWFVENGPLIADFTGKILDLIVLLAENAAIVITDVLMPVLSGLIDIILGLAKTIMQVVTGDWEGAWITIQETVTLAWEAIKVAFEGLAAWVTGWFGSSWAEVVAMWAENWEMFKIIVTEAWQFIVTKFQTATTTIITKLTAFVSKAIAKWTELKESFVTTWNDLWETAKSTIDEAKDFIIDKLNGIKDGFNNVKDAIQSVIDKINSFLDGLKKVKIPDWLKGQSPPPLANWLDDIATSLEATNMQIAQMASNMGTLSTPEMRMAEAPQVMQSPVSQLAASGSLGNSLQVGPNTIEDPMSLAMLEATVERVVSRKFG